MIERKVYSQHGEDGIIECLTKGLEPRVAYEIGSEDGKECNTRLLAEKGWEVHQLDAKNGQWITPDNINKYITKPHSFLSIDVDGQEFWLWQALELKAPVVCIEYNAKFGKKKAVTVPRYDDFHWKLNNPLGGKLNHGASLKALTYLAWHKGYRLVYVESSGTNAFFSLTGNGLDPEEAYKPTRKTYRKGGGTIRWDRLDEVDWPFHVRVWV